MSTMPVTELPVGAHEVVTGLEAEYRGGGQSPTETGRTQCATYKAAKMHAGTLRRSGQNPDAQAFYDVAMASWTVIDYPSSLRRPLPELAQPMEGTQA